jgi:hypothetical protein
MKFVCVKDSNIESMNKLYINRNKERSLSKCESIVLTYRPFKLNPGIVVIAMLADSGVAYSTKQKPFERLPSLGISTLVIGPNAEKT